MKGVVLAGGLGKRLAPLTNITNKHLLPVYDRSMICYPIETLVRAGIRDIMVVTGGEHAGRFMQLLGNGEEFGLDQLHYTYQEGEDGIASALSLARNFVGEEKVCVILGDNILEDDIGQQVRQFEQSDPGAFLFLKSVSNPGRFGVAVFDDDGNLEAIEEKPQFPRSDFAVTGVYLYDHHVFEIIDSLTPSARGEYEITDVSNHYLKQGKAGWCKLSGWWSDAGTFESLYRASRLVREGKLAAKEVGRK